jgi:hypothetical protein
MNRTNMLWCESSGTARGHVGSHVWFVDAGSDDRAIRATVFLTEPNGAETNRAGKVLKGLAGTRGVETKPERQTYLVKTYLCLLHTYFIYGMSLRLRRLH